MSRQKRFIMLFFAGGLAGLLVIWWIIPQTGSLSRPGLPTCRTVEDMVRYLVLAEAADKPNWQSRSTFTGSHLTGLAGQSLWDNTFPVQYARERVFLLGNDAIKPLIAIVNDPLSDKGIHDVAWSLLVEFDDPRTRQMILDQLKSKRLTPLDADWLLRRHLAMAINSPLLSSSLSSLDDRLESWLEQTKGVSRGELGLRLLDDMMTTDVDISSNRGNIERWLNRIYDQDIDEWLKEKAPDALAFRNRELARGYDPVVSFERLCVNLERGLVDEGIKAVFADPQTQVACHRLLDVTCGSADSSPLRIPATNGWEKRLRQWYIQHRSELKYDQVRLRYVVGNASVK